MWTEIYPTCSYMCCEKLDKRLGEMKLRVPAKVIFDKGTEHASLLDRGYRKFYAQKNPTYLEPSAGFDDAEFIMPLLAADLYAWLMAKERNEPSKPAEDEVNRALVEIHKIPPLGTIVTWEAIRRIMEK